MDYGDKMIGGSGGFGTTVNVPYPSWFVWQRSGWDDLITVFAYLAVAAFAVWFVMKLRK
jgi:cyanate permease